jgi:hypothetical protein
MREIGLRVVARVRAALEWIRWFKAAYLLEPEERIGHFEFIKSRYRRHRDLAAGAALDKTPIRQFLRIRISIIAIYGELDRLFWL